MGQLPVEVAKQASAEARLQVTRERFGVATMAEAGPVVELEVHVVGETAIVERPKGLNISGKKDRKMSGAGDGHGNRTRK